MEKASSNPKYSHADSITTYPLKYYECNKYGNYSIANDVRIILYVYFIIQNVNIKRAIKRFKAYQKVIKEKLLCK